MSKKLYRSSRQKLIAGVCGGLAEYFNMDVSIIRLIWAISVLFGGISLFLYIIAALIMPVEENAGGTTVSDENGNVIYSDTDTNVKDRSLIFFGVLLIIIGGIVLANYFFPFREIVRSVFRIFRSFVWPLVLIIGGLLIVRLLRRRVKD